jgi:hypothetical protein
VNRLSLEMESKSRIELRHTTTGLMHSLGLALYRASDSPAPENLRPLVSLRPPMNVPFVVDNLWEWTRPEGHPSRRTGCFACPTPSAALKSQPANQKSYVRRLASLPHGWMITQHILEDAKFDPDVRSLPKYLRRAFGPEWFGIPMAQKQPECLLFCPVLSKDEVQQIIDASKILNATDLASQVTYWNRVRLCRFGEDKISPEGEIFFSIPPEGVSFELT